MVALPDTAPLVTVTVIEVPLAAEPADQVAVATPLALVVACVTTMDPAEAANVTATLGTTLLAALLKVAVMVALLLPSAAIVAELDTTVTFVTPVEVVVPVPVVPVLLPVLELIPLRASELPPHAASSTLHKTAVIDNTFRMLFVVP